MKKLTIVVVVFLLILAAWFARDLFQLPGFAASFYAKEVCSCMFVTGRDQGFCLDYAKQIVPPGDFSVEPEKKVVRARIFYSIRKGIYKNPQLGCTLYEGDTETENRN